MNERVAQVGTFETPASWGFADSYTPQAAKSSLKKEGQKRHTGFRCNRYPRGNDIALESSTLPEIGNVFRGDARIMESVLDTAYTSIFLRLWL